MIDRKIYTGYIANIRTYVDNGLVPITICGKAPSFYAGLQYKKLAPSWEIYSNYKSGKYSEVDYEFYFNRNILSILTRHHVINDIFEMTMNQSAVLLCYEIPTKFCHRHLVANWINELAALDVSVPYITECAF